MVNNAVKYQSITFGGMYAFSNKSSATSGQGSGFSDNRLWAAGLSYGIGPLKLGAVYEQLDHPGDDAPGSLGAVDVLDANFTAARQRIFGLGAASTSAATSALLLGVSALDLAGPPYAFPTMVQMAADQAFSERRVTGGNCLDDGFVLVDRLIDCVYLKRQGRLPEQTEFPDKAPVRFKQFLVADRSGHRVMKLQVQVTIGLPVLTVLCALH